MPIATDIFNIKSEEDFNACALEIYAYQYRENEVYRSWCRALGKLPQTAGGAINCADDIPFMPVSFFKNHKVYAAAGAPEILFTSSGTTGAVQSRHEVASVKLYEESFTQCFNKFYGPMEAYTILALLPAYSEREGSSLIYMVDHMMAASNDKRSGYYLYNHGELYDMLMKLKAEGRKVVLFGVTYALLDFTEKYRVDFPELTVMETGGMKGRRKEMIREELHAVLCAGFNTPVIHSEYGMTELLSQAYSKGDGIFYCPPWMRIMLRDINDPLAYAGPGRTGGINVVDLANLYSCSFIATQDLGMLHAEGGFSVLGRYDNSDVRGCNLLVQ